MHSARDLRLVAQRSFLLRTRAPLADAMLIYT
jgi:hypothetical protein